MGSSKPRIERGSRNAESCHAKPSSVLSTPPMVRRVPSQVHKQALRLLQAGYLKREPAWFQAVLEHPPLPLPFEIRPSTFPEKKKVGIAKKPLEIAYSEDELRWQFFRDHPFEVFRPTSLVEGKMNTPFAGRLGRDCGRGHGILNRRSEHT